MGEWGLLPSGQVDPCLQWLLESYICGNDVTLDGIFRWNFRFCVGK